MVVKPKKPLESYTDIETDVDKLTIIVANAERHGEMEYALAARRQRAILRGAKDVELELRFDQIIEAYEAMLTEKNKRTTKASRTRMKVKSKGIEKTIIDWAKSATPAEGFTSLIKDGRPELTAEYLVVELQDRFSAEVVEAASKRLLHHGVKLPV
ncbi:MAG: hypothetical protein ACOYLK_04590 [Sphingomonas sp.]